jgi:hypothetical protein
MSKVITTEEAKTMTDLHRKNNADAAHSHTFDAAHIRELLKDENVTGLRIDHGVGSDNKGQLIAVGVNSKSEPVTTMVSYPWICPGDPRCPCPPYCE